MATKGRCPTCGNLTIEEWVHQINQKAHHMYEWEVATHPSSWHEMLADDREQYTKIAQAPTCDCEEKANARPKQLSF